MSKELDYTRNHKITYIKWGAVYLLLFAFLAAIFLLVANRIHTYSIPKGSFELTVPYAKYVVGDTVTFTLKNNFNSPAYVANECPREPLAVYKLENETWVRVHDEAPSDSCELKDRQILIPAGGQQAGSFAAWKNLFASPGKYRIVAYVEYFDAMPYQDFEVIAKPAPVATIPAQAQSPNTRSGIVPTIPQQERDDDENGEDVSDD